MRFILVRAPLRLPLGGGGTDLACYYEQHGGFWTAATIDRFVRLTLSARWEGTWVTKHGIVVDRTDDLSGITNPIIRAAYEFTEIEKFIFDRVGHNVGLETNIISDVPTKSGMGVSGAMCVALLHALYTFMGNATVSRAQLAEDGYRIEHDLAGSLSVGKQDHYSAAFGGIASYEATRKGTVDVLPLGLSTHVVSELLDNLLVFGTGIIREETADETLQKQSDALKSKGSVNAEYLKRIEQIGLQQRDALLEGDVHRFGELFDIHWETKKSYSSHGSQPEIDQVYEAAKKAGALGGKVVGAGTRGAFWLFYCENEKDKLRQVMSELGKEELIWQFVYTGSLISHIE